MNDYSYVNWSKMTDEGLVKTIGDFIKKNRLQQNKTQHEVAQSAGISRSTLSLLERGQTVTITTFIQVLRALDLLHVMNTFKVSDEISPLAYAKLKRKERERASRNPNVLNEPKEDLEW